MAPADNSAKDILHALSVTTTMQTGTYIPPTEACQPIIGKLGPVKGFAVSVGIPLGYFFINTPPLPQKIGIVGF